MKTLGLFLLPTLLIACAHAQSTGILRGDSHKTSTLQESLQSVRPGSIVVIGENHGFKEHQRQQVAIMQQLRDQGLKVSVGMEFFTYTQQPLVNQYRAGTLAESDFLKAIAWGSPSYDLYRDQAIFPNLTEGAATIALNAPRSLTGKVAKQGLNSLTPEESALMPPQFSLGRESYKKRFMAMMPHLPNPEVGERYFAAQSIWDDTMAWQATNFIHANPEQVLVIVVGDFHVQYGGGLPDRIKARFPQAPVISFSQVNTLNLSDKEIAEQIQVIDSEARADFLWLAPSEPSK